MTLVYRTVWRDERGAIHETGRAHFAAWHTEKGIAVDVPTNQSMQTGHVEVIHRSVDDGTNRADQFMLSEDRSNVRGDFWKTTLTTISERSANWMWMDLEGVAENAYASRPVWSPPRLVMELLKDGTARAGPTRLMATPVQVQSHDVADLVGDIVDSQRTVPVVVITLGTLDRLADVQKRSEHAARRLAGLARVVYLAGPAIARLNDALGEELRVLPGGIRTYFPGAGQENDVAGRHRYEPAVRVARHERAASDALAELIFPRSASQRPPAVYRQSLRVLFSSRSSADVEAFFDEMVGEIEDLQERLNQALQDLEVARGQHEAAIKELDDSAKRVSWLEQRLAESGDYVRGVATPEDDDVTSLQEVADFVRAKFKHLTFSAGADSDLARLDAHANASNWARKSLQAFQALDEYARLKQAGDLSGDFRSANMDSRLGQATIQVGWIAMNESETTTNNTDFRQARTFVIEQADGRQVSTYMPAHVKIAEGGQPCPRIHFHVEEAVGFVRIHIGWFGDHLKNSRTS